MNDLVAREVATVCYNWKTVLPLHRYCCGLYGQLALVRLPRRLCVVFVSVSF